MNDDEEHPICDMIENELTFLGSYPLIYKS